MSHEQGLTPADITTANLELDAKEETDRAMGLVNSAKIIIKSIGGAKLFYWDQRITTTEQQDDPKKLWRKFEETHGPTTKRDGSNNWIIDSNLKRYGVLRKLGFSASSENPALIDLGQGSPVGYKDTIATIFDTSDPNIFVVRTKTNIQSIDGKPLCQQTEMLAVARNKEDLEKSIIKNLKNPKKPKTTSAQTTPR